MFNLGLGFILGLCLGSFIKCLADRSLTNESFWGRSYCEYCHKQLHWYDLFPVISYLLAGGHCRHCHHRLSPTYLIFEVTTALIVSIWLYFLPPNLSQPSSVINSLIQLIIIGLSLAVIQTDLIAGLIPDRLTYPSFWLILSLVIINSLIGFSTGLPLVTLLLSPLLTAFGVGLFFGSVILLTRGQGMGGGDLKFGIVIGLALGFPNAVVALMLAFISGSIIGLGLIVFGRRTLNQTIPFGPFMSLGVIAAIFWSNQLINWYLNLHFN